ncbi:MAG TPA: hypothetical protein VKN35_13150 [Xanthomonadales bacterium]|nr:hypothetical protein [Xanthomonadales bacterium]
MTLKPFATFIALCILLLSAAVRAEEYFFVALGDTSYEIPDDYPLYRSLIATINAANPGFSIHVGDTKGWGSCDDGFQLGQKAFFDSFKHPVVYTFGNNEWADCWKENRGSMDPLAVLQSMRAIFFAEAASMGQAKMALQRQSDGEGFPKYSENVRWATRDVTFATVNVVGEHNNQLLRNEALWREFVDREQANVAWITAAFQNAASAGHKAIVVALHSDVFSELGKMEGGAFQPVLQAISEGAAGFAGQVLVVHGHEHTFIIDRPLRVWDAEASTSVGDNVTRLEVYGWPDMKAVRVSVDTSKPWVFGFEPLYTEPSLSPAFQD